MKNARRIAIAIAATVGILAMLTLFCGGFDLVRQSFNPNLPSANELFWRGCLVMLGSTVTLIMFGIITFAEPVRDWLNRPVMERLDLMRSDALLQEELLVHLHGLIHELEPRRRRNRIRNFLRRR